MSEIPMPGGYDSPEPQRASSEGFCSQCCENTCRAVATCFMIVVIVLLFVFLFFF
jgi:hypothetical protein